jgi:hypothetical protein
VEYASIAGSFDGLVADLAAIRDVEFDDAVSMDHQFTTEQAGAPYSCSTETGQ